MSAKCHKRAARETGGQRADGLSVAINAGFPAHEIGAIIRHLRSQRDVLEGKWHEHFGN